MKIKKRDGSYYVISETGRLLGGPYPTKARARTRILQIDYFARRRSLSERMREIYEQ